MSVSDPKENIEDWEDDDVKVGNGLMIITILFLIASIVALSVMGYQKRPLIGWPLLIGCVFVLLRVWKGMLRNTIAEAKTVVELKQNMSDETTIEEAVFQQRDSRDERLKDFDPSLPTLIGGGLVYATLITLFWYGFGRLIGWFVGLF